jgi:hypothetical protein
MPDASFGNRFELVYGFSANITTCADAGRPVSNVVNDPGAIPRSGLANDGCIPGPGIVPVPVDPITVGVKNVLLVYVTVNFGRIP